MRKTRQDLGADSVNIGKYLGEGPESSQQQCNHYLIQNMLDQLKLTCLEYLFKYRIFSYNEKDPAGSRRRWDQDLAKI